MLLALLPLGAASHLPACPSSTRLFLRCEGVLRSRHRATSISLETATCSSSRDLRLLGITTTTTTCAHCCTLVCTLAQQRRSAVDKSFVSAQPARTLPQLRCTAKPSPALTQFSQRLAAHAPPTASNPDSSQRWSPSCRSPLPGAAAPQFLAPNAGQSPLSLYTLPPPSVSCIEHQTFPAQSHLHPLPEWQVQHGLEHPCACAATV